LAARRKYLGVALLVIATVSVAGFAGWRYAIWPLNQHSEVALARRAQRFWDLKLSGDTLGAYDYMAESYRRRITPSGFGREGQGLVIHTGAKVQSVQLDDKGGAVQIELKHILNKEPFDKTEATSVITERWVFENGEWYRWPMG
jgi:hypothetical protein